MTAFVIEAERLTRSYAQYGRDATEVK